MIKVSVFYPNSDGCNFDIEYYCLHHMPLVQRLCGAALQGVAVERGIGGEMAGVPPAFIALGHLLFDSVDAFQSSFGPHVEEIKGDITNYTNIKPIIQISEVKL